MAFDAFKVAQQSAHGGYAAALEELRAGRKTSHWIWYIFPQLSGLGSSSMARAYALQDLREAVDYLRDPVLRARLAEITGVVAAQLSRGAQLRQLMGGEIDALKLVSSLTLFERAGEWLATRETSPELTSFLAACRSTLAAATTQGYPRCRYTLDHT